MEDIRAAVDFPLPASDVTTTYNGVIRIDVLKMSKRTYIFTSEKSRNCARLDSLQFCISNSRD